jgi:tetratricopeptide (TPR) repeat protein
MMQPGNENATSQLIELNCGISNTDAAISVMNDFINQQFKIKNGNRAMAFLENFSRMHPEFLFINQRLGEIYSQAGLNKKAIDQWQNAAEVAKELDNKTEARSFYQMIISLEPNNIDEYRQKMLEI